jgi:hypothetical protein
VADGSGAGLPFIFGSDFRPAVSGYYEFEKYPSFEAVAIGELVSLSYPVIEQVQATVGARHAAIRTKSVEPGVPPGDLLDFSYSAPFVSAIWDSRDSRCCPPRACWSTGASSTPATPGAGTFSS